MVKKILYRLLYGSVVQTVHRWRRGMTLGTRTAVFDEAGRVLLVRHTYSEGWVLPGGGVERNETIFESAMREVQEEANVHAEEVPVLMGFCNNDEVFPGDHVAILVLRRFTRQAFVPNSEIAAAEFFHLDGLPPDTTRGTLRRINELSQSLPIAHKW